MGEDTDLDFTGDFLAVPYFFFWAVDADGLDIGEPDGELDCALPADFLRTVLLDCFALLEAEWDLETVDSFVFLGDVPALCLEECTTKDGFFFFWGEVLFLIWPDGCDVELKAFLAASENCNSPSSSNVMLPCSTESKHNYAQCKGN